MSDSWCVCEHPCECIYGCVCYCGSGRGRAEKAFCSISSNSGMVLCSRTLQTVALPGAPGVAERSHAASKKQDSTAGQSIWSKHAPPPSNHRNKEERWGGVDFSIRHRLTLSPVQTRKNNWRYYHYNPSCSLNTLLHLAPCPLLGADRQKICQKLQNKLKDTFCLKKTKKKSVHIEWISSHAALSSLNL